MFCYMRFKYEKHNLITTVSRIESLIKTFVFLSRGKNGKFPSFELT